MFDPEVFYWQWVTDKQYHHKRWLRRQQYEKDPRPANVWIGFRSYCAHKYRDLKRKGPRVLDAVIRRLYEECKKTPEGKTLLELIEEYELVRHEQEYPDYKYAPRRREPKDPVERDNHATEKGERRITYNFRCWSLMRPRCSIYQLLSSIILLP